MRHGLAELYEAIPLADSEGFPLRALMAAVAEQESNGDPDEWIAHDPPTNPNAGPSAGLYQVHQPSWPAEYAATESVRLSSASDDLKIARMTEIAKPVLAAMLAGAARAAAVLRARGMPAGPLNTALFVDAAWQTGPEALIAWARRTTTGDPREIVNPTRTLAVEVALRNLAHEALGVNRGAAVAFGVVGALVVGALVLSQLDF